MEPKEREERRLMKMKSKVNLLLICLLGLILGGAIYGYLTIKSILMEELRERVFMTEAFGSSVRRYLVENQRPIALQYISTFYPELMSSTYTVRRVMELFGAFSEKGGVVVDRNQMTLSRANSGVYFPIFLKPYWLVWSDGAIVATEAEFR